MTNSSSTLKADNAMNSPIGYVVGGGLKANLFVRLTIPADQVQEGGFVVLESGNWQFYGLVTDLQLGASAPRYAELPNTPRLSALTSRLLAEQTLFTNLEVLLPGGQSCSQRGLSPDVEVDAATLPRLPELLRHARARLAAG